MTSDTAGKDAHPPHGHTPSAKDGKRETAGEDLASPKQHHRKSEIDGVDKMLQDAQYLLDYAAESGIELETEMVQTIVAASTDAKLNNEEIVKVIGAVSKLSKRLQPVTAETLRNFEKANLPVAFYSACTFILGALLILASALSFIATGFSKSIDDDIARANELAVTLTAGLGQPAAAPTPALTVVPLPQGEEGPRVVALNASPSVSSVDPLSCGLAGQASTNPKDLTNLQTFAATSREVYGLAQQLREIVFFAPEDIKIDKPLLEIKYPVNVPCEVKEKIESYQKIRDYAKSIQHQTALIYGALNISILPAFYAALGAFAFLLKSLSEQLAARRFVLSFAADFARLTMAAICGEVIGLFSGLFTMGSGPSLPLLGLAFLVGYHTDIFFSALDRLQTAIAKPKADENLGGVKR